MKVHIQRQLNGLHTVCKLDQYSTNLYRTITKFNGYNIFNQSLGYSTIDLPNKEVRYKSGEALSSAMDYTSALKFIRDNELELATINLHTTQYIELHPRYFK